MFDSLTPFLVHWGITTLSLWVASHLLKGARFESVSALLVAALLLGVANAVVKPLLIVLTLPLTLVTFGFFLLVINALMVMLVSAIVRGFSVSGFWTAMMVSIVVSIVSFLIGLFVVDGTPPLQPTMGGTWV